MMDIQNLIRRSEIDPKGSVTNASTGGTVPLVELALWFAKTLQTVTGKPFVTIYGAVRYGLRTVVLPFVGGGYWLNCDHNPADRAEMIEGTARCDTYNFDHTGQLVNPALEEAYRLRKSAVDLVTGIREIGACLSPGCFVHPVHGTTTCGCNAGSDTYGVTGDIAPAFHQKVNAGLSVAKKTPVLGAYGPTDNRRVKIVGTRTLVKRSGAGKSGGSKTPAYRFATVCECGRRTCWGACGTDNHMRFTLVMSTAGRTLVGIDPRRYDFNEVIALLTECLGGVPPVVEEYPFSRV